MHKAEVDIPRLALFKEFGNIEIFEELVLEHRTNLTVMIMSSFNKALRSGDKELEFADKQ